MSHVTFSDLRTAAYCPRQLYYRRQETDTDRSPSERVAAVRALAFSYEDSIEATDSTLSSLPIAVDPATYRNRLDRARNRIDCWSELVDPGARDVLLTGRDCRGIAQKILADPPVPSLVSPGRPPRRGVWAPQSVHAVAAAKALAWERERTVDRAIVEYPAYGVIRPVQLTIRRKIRYRRALRAVRSMEGLPSRCRNRSKCPSCEYAGQCGVRTRTLRSLLGI